MLFAKPGELEPCGMFTKGHLELIILTVIGIIVTLKKTVNKTKEEIREIIRKITKTMWLLEIIIIAFKLYTGEVKNVNNYVPLYYCSMLLYAGILSSYTEGKLRRIGDVFLATGGIVGGIVFLIMPTTSLPAYPMLHIVSLHSFFFHGTMVYIGLLINITHYIEIEFSDIKYYAMLVGIVCMLAYIMNSIFDSNLMFISKNFPGTPLEILYNITGPLYTVIVTVAQMTLPFYIVKTCTRLKFIQLENGRNTLETDFSDDKILGGKNEKVSINRWK